jgi:plastocyanin
MSRPRFSTPVTILAVLAVVLAACASTGASPSAPVVTATGTATPSAEPEATPSPSQDESAAPSASDEELEDVDVRIQGSRYDPAEVIVPVGTRVVFVNVDPFDHTVTEGSGGQPTDDPIVDAQLAQNASASVTFDEPGTYEITCRLHPTMRMTITVEG